jgi:hypothetical protein
MIPLLVRELQARGQSIELQLIVNSCQNLMRIRIPVNLIKLVMDLIGRCSKFKTLARLL